MRKKRISAFLLSLCMMLSMVVTAHAAETKLQVDVPKTLPAVGETFTVTVSIAGNPGLGAVQLTLNFDDSVIDCTEVIEGSVLDRALSATNPNASDGARLAAASLGELRGDGELLLCSFKVLKSGDPAFALKDVKLRTAEGDAINASSNLPDATVAPEVPKEEKPEVSKPEDPAEKPEEPENEPEDKEEVEEETEEEVEEEEEISFSPTFVDVPKSHWAYEYIEKAAAKGLIGGYSNGTFRPGNQVTRAQFVTMMWRMAGRPASSGNTPFSDIGGVSAEFRSAIAWAYENGYIGGRTATTFAPNDSLTRQAAMKVLFLYSGGRSGQELLFTKIYDDNFIDSGSLSPWAKEAMYWAVYNELLSGTTPTTLGAGKTATRGQLAKILVNYSEAFGS